MKKKNSSFGISVNLNKKTPQSVEQAVEEHGELKNAIKDIFGDKKSVKPIIDIIEPSGSWSDVKKVKTNFAIELGEKPRGGRVGAHLHVSVDHNTKIRINIEELKSMVKSKLGIGDDHNININVKITGGYENWLSYMEKNKK